MTSYASPAAAVGGVGSMLAIWSFLVVIIGAALFVYGMVVSLRGRRGRKRRKRPAATAARSRPSPQPDQGHGFTPPSGPLPSGPTAGNHLSTGRSRALPAGPHRSRPELPAGPVRVPMPPPPASSPMLPHRPAPIPLSATPATPPPAWPPVAPTPVIPVVYGSRQLTSPASSIHSSAQYGTPVSSVPAGLGAGLSPVSSMPVGEATMRFAAQSESTMRVPPMSDSTVRVPAPRTERQSSKDRDRKRADGCAQLRSECAELTATATALSAAAAQAAAEAESARQDYAEAQQTAAEARRAHESLVRETAEITAQLASLERDTTVGQQQLERETSHAAFAAFRRGDISSDELREVFRRAEGWTPEHDRLSHRSSEIRAEEADTARLRDSTRLAEEVAAERAHTTAMSARTLDDEARMAMLDARARCAAADACEERSRQR